MQYPKDYKDIVFLYHRYVGTPLPGPINFLVPGKCSLFEAITRQVELPLWRETVARRRISWLASQLLLDNHGLGELLRFLIHISQTVTKEPILKANSILFTGEKTVYVFMPTTVQGRTRATPWIQYLLWRSTTNRHTDTTPLFLVVGHTKFRQTVRCFGFVKRLYSEDGN